MAQKLLIKALSDSRKALIIRKVAATLKDSVFSLVTDLLKQWQIYNYCTVNLTTYSITLPNGSELLFKGLDDPEKIKSVNNITDIWIEESTELTLDDFTQLDLRLRTQKPHLQIFLSFNPVSKVNWVYKKWFDHQAPDDNTLILKTTYKDNPFLSDSYIQSLETMIDSNPTYYRVYALGEFCSLDRLVYTHWRPATLFDTPTGTQICGLDFGYTNDPSALIIAKADTNNRKLYIIDEYCKTGMLNNEIADLIKYKGLSKEIIIADSAEQKSIEEIRRCGIQRIKAATKGQGSIKQGIARLQEFEIIVDPKCTNTITELQNYSYKKDRASNEYTNEPNDSYNHCLDALRYAIQAVDSQPQLKTINKSLLGI